MTEISSSSTHPKTYTVIAGLDFSELGDRAIGAAIELATGHPKADLHVVCVGEAQGSLIALPNGDTSTEEAAREAAVKHVASIVSDYQSQFGNIGLERIAVYVVPGDPPRQIVALAKALDADLVVLGTHGRKGVQRLLLGSVAEGVLRHADCNVFVVRPPDFVRGVKVPDVQPPLQEGEPHLRHFEHRRTYHHVERISKWTQRMMPAI
jgi:nucleotide-binding universal stress UspA family protein